MGLGETTSGPFLNYVKNDATVRLVIFSKHRYSELFLLELLIQIKPHQESTQKAGPQRLILKPVNIFQLDLKHRKFHVEST